MTGTPAERAALRCHMYRGHAIPGCWSRAIDEDNECHCPQPAKVDDSNRLDRIEAEIAELRAIVLGNREGRRCS